MLVFKLGWILSFTSYVSYKWQPELHTSKIQADKYKHIYRSPTTYVVATRAHTATQVDSKSV